MTTGSNVFVGKLTRGQFDDLVVEIEKREGYKKPAAFALGIATFTEGADGAEVPLDTWYPVVNLNENFGSAALLAEQVEHLSGSTTYRLNESQVGSVLECFDWTKDDRDHVHANVQVLQELRELLQKPAQPIGTSDIVLRRAVVVTYIEDLAAPPVDAHDIYLRLHLLSNRKVKPRGLNLDGMIPQLPIVVWTSVGPFHPAAWQRTRLRLRTHGVEPTVYAVDKFPRMVDYVVPSGVRIADADRVRLGAYLGDGTVVMQEGFCNFNAGTLGKAMVEGRISAGVVVGDGSDIGGGASIMGTLSGGGTEVITIGERCLIGANAGTGISLGDNCVIQSGCYVQSTAKVKIMPSGVVVRASELSGKPNLRYWHNSQTGALEAWPRQDKTELNPLLHQGAAAPAP